MLKLVYLVGTTFILSIISFKRDVWLKIYEKKDRLVYAILVIFLIFFAGLRYHWNDTQTYINGYKYSGIILTNFSAEVKFYSDYYAYYFVRALCKTLKMDEHLYIMLFSAFYVTVYMWFIRKYAREQFPLVMLLFVLNGYTFLFAALKQVTAVAFGLIAIDRAISKKWIQYCAFLFLGYLFHPSIIVFLVVPILYGSKPWSLKTYIFIAVLFVMGVGMRYTSRFLSGFLNTSEEGILDHTVNPLRFAIYVAPVFLSFLYRDRLYADSNPVEDLMFHLHLSGVMFMFWALFGNPILFARLTDSFSVMTCISIGWMLWKIDGDDLEKGKIGQWTVIACLCYIALNLCSNYFLCAEPYKFDNQYRAISLRDFFRLFYKWAGLSL